jgi:hypothetical protein
MSSNDIIPAKDIDFNDWQNKFYTRVQANLTAWGIPSWAFNPLTPLKMEWDASWLIAGDKKNRNSGDVARKNAAYKKYVAGLRTFMAACITYNPLISDEARTELDLPIHDKELTPAPVPGTTPKVETHAGFGNQIIVRYEQTGFGEGSTKFRAKPPHVHHMEFRYKIGGPPPASPSDCGETELISKIPYKINFNSTDSGKTLYWYARWVNTRNQPGPWTHVYASIVIP